MERTPTKGKREETGWSVAGRAARPSRRDPREDMTKVWMTEKKTDKKKEITVEKKNEKRKEGEENEDCQRCNCRVGTGQLGLMCDLCCRWYHIKCEKVSKEEYDAIGKAGEKVKWFCACCEDGIKNLHFENSELRKEVRKLEDRVSDVEEKHRKMMVELMKKMSDEVAGRVKKEMESMVKAQLEEMMDLQQQEFSKLRAEVDVAINRRTPEGEADANNNSIVRLELEGVKREMVDAGRAEMRRERKKEEKKMEELEAKVEEIEKERRKKNLMIFNLKESESEVTQQRLQHDLEKGKTIFEQELGMANVMMENLIRIGRRGEQPRPLLVKLASEEDRREALKRSGRLRDSEEFSRVFLGRDLTQEERRKDKELREELRRRQGEDGSTRFAIRRGRVVRVEQRSERTGAAARGGSDHGRGGRGGANNANFLALEGRNVGEV